VVSGIKMDIVGSWYFRESKVKKFLVIFEITGKNKKYIKEKWDFL